MSDGPILLTAREAAKLLAVSERTLYTRTAGKLIPHLRIGKLVRYSRPALEAWVAEQVKLPAGPAAH